MDHSGHVEAIRREGDLFAAVAPADIDVPTCPGWTLVDLYHHLGSVHRWQLAQLDGGDPTSLRPAPPVDQPTDPDDLVDWFLDGVEDLTTRLDELGPDQPAPSFAGPRTTAFWSRRAAVETAVHRWDAQAAVTSPRPVDAALAVDAIDEILDVAVPRRLASDPWPDPPATIHLHATDVDGEWLIGVSGQALTVEHTHAKGDVALRAPASDLLLVLCGRLPATRTELFGDTAVVDRWSRSVRI